MASEKENLQAARKEIRKLSAEAARFSRTLRQTGSSMQKVAQQFASGMEQMQLQASKMQSEMNQAGNEKPPSFFGRLAEFSNKLGEFNQKVAGFANDLSNIALGTTLDAVQNEAKAAAKERGLYAAKGKTPEEMKRFDELTNKLAVANPYMDRSQAMTLITKSEQFNPRQAEAYAEQLAKLSVTTQYTPEEHLKMMDALRQGTGVDSADRLANSIQYMNNHAGDLNGDFVESIVEFAQNGKLLDTPEKMATLVGEIGKMGIWSDDKALAALKDSTLKISDKGELTKLLKTQYEAQGKGKEAANLAEKETAAITQALASGGRDEQRIALGKMMMSLAAIQDKAVQKKVLQELGGSAAEDLGADFTRVLEAAGKLATGETRTQVGNEVKTAYQAAKEANPYFGEVQAQSAAKQEAIEAATTFAKDFSYVSESISLAAARLIGQFNDLGDTARKAAEYFAVIVAGIAVGVAAIGKAQAFFSLGKEVIEAGRNLAPRKENKRAGSPPPERGTGGSTPDRNAGGSAAAASHAPGGNNQNSESAATKDTAKNQASSPPPDTGNESGAGPRQKKSWLSRIKDSKFVTKLPSWMKSAVKLPALFTSKNKLATAGGMGAEALGSWGGRAAGAAAGAAIGSVIPILGTAAGGIIGGLVGGFGGSMLGSAAFDGIKSWFQNPSAATANDHQAVPAGPPVPASSSVSGARQQPQPVSVAIPQITIPLHADGVLQDIPTMLKMLGDPTVGQKIKSIIEKSLLDALETRGGVPV